MKQIGFGAIARADMNEIRNPIKCISDLTSPAEISD